MARTYEDTPAIPEIMEDHQGNTIGMAYPMEECTLLVELDGRVNLVAEQSMSRSGLKRLYATLGEVLKREVKAGE